MDIYNRCHRNIFSIEQDLRRILIIERRLAILSISYNQTSMNSLHTDLMTISSKGNLWCLAPKSEKENKSKFSQLIKQVIKSQYKTN